MFRHVHTRALPAVLIAAPALVVSGLMSPATAAGTGSIKGVVTVNGTPVSFAKVQIFPLVIDAEAETLVVGARLKTDNTDSSGRYSFSGLATTNSMKRYVVLVTDRTSRTVKTYRSLIAKSGKTITQNVRMRPAAILKGTVTTSDGRSPAGLTVDTQPGLLNDLGQSYDKLFPEFSTTVRADGTFTLAGIPGSQYEQIRVSDGPHAQQCYDFVTSTLADCATKSNQEPAYYERQRIVLASGEKRTLPTVTVSKFNPPMTTVSGTVTDTSGKTLKGITVTIDSVDTGAAGATRSSGRFTIKETLPAGEYRVRFRDPKNVWASQYLGRSIAITPGKAVRGVATKLKSISTAKIGTRGGEGTAKVAFKIKRKASGSAPSGTLKLSYEGISRTVLVTKGTATVTLRGLPAGTLSLVADYSGTGSTAGFSKIVKVAVS
ncbi:MAG: carboxypeptidase-like regulatory domain-containing protein [Aeromicrobium sp.]